MDNTRDNGIVNNTDKKFDTSKRNNVESDATVKDDGRAADNMKKSYRRRRNRSRNRRGNRRGYRRGNRRGYRRGGYQRRYCRGNRAQLKAKDTIEKSVTENDLKNLEGALPSNDAVASKNQKRRDHRRNKYVKPKDEPDEQEATNSKSVDDIDPAKLVKRKHGRSHVKKVEPQVIVTSRWKEGPLVSTLKYRNNIKKELRQHYLNKLYTELIEMLPECVASKKAIYEEHMLHEEVTSLVMYRKKIRTMISQLSLLKRTSLPDFYDSYLNEQLEYLHVIIEQLQYPEVIQEYPTRELLAHYIITDTEYDINGYPMLIQPDGTIAKVSPDAVYYKAMSTKKCGNRYICISCNEKFNVNSSGYPIMGGKRCVFHPGRLRREFGAMLYSCCSAERSQLGCTNKVYHAPDTFDEDKLKGFVETKERPEDCYENMFYALDCEMCYTTAGIELTRVTVVNMKCEVNFDSYVKPSNPILDYCTRYSGITEEKLKDVTKTLEDVQQELLEFIFKDTILIGHSMENDLKSLKIIHRNVIDTSVMYPHRRSPRIKFGLKHLAATYINMTIQEGESGHDSAEDATACMKLVWNKLKEIYRYAP